MRMQVRTVGGGFTSEIYFGVKKYEFIFYRTPEIVLRRRQTMARWFTAISSVSRNKDFSGENN